MLADVDGGGLWRGGIRMSRLLPRVESLAQRCARDCPGAGTADPLDGRRSDSAARKNAVEQTVVRLKAACAVTTSRVGSQQSYVVTGVDPDQLNYYALPVRNCLARSHYG